MNLHSFKMIIIHHYLCCMITHLFAVVMHLRTLVLLLIYAPITMWHASTLDVVLHLPPSPQPDSRSPQESDANIDFDEASFQWRRNKRSIGNGEFTYIHTNTSTALVPYTPPQHNYFLRSRKNKRTDAEVATPEMPQEDAPPGPVKRPRYNLRGTSKKL